MEKGLITESFSLNLRVMKVFGLYPPHRHKYLYRLFAYLLYFLFIVPIPLFGILYLLIEEDIDLAKVSENAFLLAEMGCFITKFLPFLLNAYKIKNCILYFESSISEVNTNYHQKVINDCKRTCRRNTKIFLYSVTSGYVSWAIKPLFSGSHKLPVDIWLPFKEEFLKDKYLWIYAYLVIAVAFAAYCSGASDPLVAGLAYQATSQFKILKNKLQNLSNTTNVFKEIQHCIVFHNVILKFVAEYEACFSVVIFSQFVGSVVVICISCFELTLKDPLSFEFLAMVSFLVPMLAEIYLFCYYGTTLYEESNTLTDAIYMSNWYEHDIKSRKALTVLMERSKRPAIVTAGKVLDCTLVTFMSILRRSYSLFAVLKNYK